jgi:outer membrane lipoprotein carrier protein
VRLVALIWAAALPVLAADPATGRLLKQIEHRYNRAETLEVRFAETYSGPGRAAKTETGTLSLRKPGRMRWDYTSPAGKLFVSDGKRLYLYLPSSNRVEKMKLSESEDMRAPLAFLLGKLNFEKEFQNIQTQPDGDGTRIVAEPKSGNLPYSKVEFVVAPDFEIRKLRVVGLDQSLLDFVFDNERVNPPLAASLFQFKTPAGAVVEESQ